MRVPEQPFRLYRRSSRYAAAALLAAALLAVLTGCSDSAGDGGGEGMAQDARGAADAPAGGMPEGRGSDSAAEGNGGDEGTAAVSERSLIKTGNVELRAKDVGEVLADLYGLADGAGGEIVSENTVTDDDGEARRSTLVLQVPVGTFAETMTRVAGLATLEHSSRRVEDVTGEVADVDSRVASAEEAIVTLRRLFARADRLGQIITLESSLAQRQAELEALQAQQRALASQTEMSTITVSVDRIVPEAAATAEGDGSGFLAGLRTGWQALKTATVAVVTLLGLFLPLGTVLAAVAIVGRLAYRRWFSSRRPPAAPSAPA